MESVCGTHVGKKNSEDDKDDSYITVSNIRVTKYYWRDTCASERL